MLFIACFCVFGIEMGCRERGLARFLYLYRLHFTLVRSKYDGLVAIKLRFSLSAHSGQIEIELLVGRNLIYIWLVCNAHVVCSVSTKYQIYFGVNNRSIGRHAIPKWER